MENETLLIRFEPATLGDGEKLIPRDEYTFLAKSSHNLLTLQIEWIMFPLTDRFTEALNLAVLWHHGQYRKVAPGEQATLPYISHLLGVASVAMEFGATEDDGLARL